MDASIQYIKQLYDPKTLEVHIHWLSAYSSHFLEAKRILNILISACGGQVIKLYSP